MRILSEIFLFLLKRRYRIKLVGEELLKKDGPKLILPNHPAQVDAMMLGTFSRRYCYTVPVVSEGFVNMPVIGRVMKSLKSIPVSDLKRGNRDPLVLVKVKKGVNEAFKLNRSPIIYPAGHIKTTAKEVIQNKQTTHAIVKELPDNVIVIGVRITGLWGSMWSTYPTKERPKFLRMAIKSMGFILGNLIFLMPKRKVTYEFVDITKTAKEIAKSDRYAFNAYLETFYNANGEEPVVEISKWFFLPSRFDGGKSPVAMEAD